MKRPAGARSLPTAVCSMTYDLGLGTPRGSQPQLPRLMPAVVDGPDAAPTLALERPMVRMFRHGIVEVVVSGSAFRISQ